MMIDFLDRDDQEMVNIQVEILKKKRNTSYLSSFTAHISLPDLTAPTRMNLHGKEH